jgi:Fic-DOC domain mobile mystery protein B
VKTPDPLLPAGDGHTELTDDDRQGLIPSYISTRAELYDAEQANILRGLPGRPPSSNDVLDDLYLRELHHSLFGEVWTWAGKYRRRETNIGVDPDRIPADVHQLVGDARAWVSFATYEIDETAVRFHHRLVAIHPFPNGNGRHGRIAANLLVVALGGEEFSWGSGQEVTTDALRKQYLDALRHADNAGDFAPLLLFARS